MKKYLLLLILATCSNYIFAQYTITGNVYNDPNGGNIDASASPFSLPKETLRAVLIDISTNTIAKTATVNQSTGVFTFTAVASGSYYAMVITPNVSLLLGDPPPVSVLETGWVRTGESLNVSGVPDGIINGSTETINVSADVFNVKFGVQERPFADNKMNEAFNNTVVAPVALDVNTANVFTAGGSAILSGSDNSGGTINNYTINVLPKYGTLYIGATPVSSLADVASLTPAQFATLSYLPNSTAIVQEQDLFTYYITDNIGAKSNNASYVIPFQLIESDKDAIANRNDLDDDNDGITDEAECALMNVSEQITQYSAGSYSFLRPSDFGFTTIEQRTGLTITQDLSAKFGYPANSGVIIATLSNANTHPTANEFYVNDSTGATQWAISGTLGVFTTVEHGQEYFSYDTRTITLLNGTPKRLVAAQMQSNPSQTNWTSGNNGYDFWLKNDNPKTTPVSQGVLVVALTDPEPKYFQVASTANNRDEWATYNIRILPECDYDMDGLPNRLDLDSDNDGCLDALEGSANFDYSDISNTDGTVWVGNGSTALNQNLCNSTIANCVDVNGIPVVAAGGQTPVNTYNASVISQVCLNVLPVSLVSFQASKHFSSVVLKWTTASEINNQGFEIERSVNGLTWTKIGFISSKAVNGNSSLQLNYTFTDNLPLKGKNYYRLKQIDIDGKFEFSEVKQVLFDSKNLISIAPNPAQVQVKIEGLSGDEMVRIYDYLGKLVMQEKTNTATLQLSINHLNDGIYQIVIIGKEGIRSTHKFIKTK